MYSGSGFYLWTKEAEGPLADYFDIRSEDPTFGKDSWEEGESEMIRQAVELAIKKADKKKKEIRYIFAGICWDS